VLAAPGVVRKLALSELKVDPAIQCREKNDEGVVEEYAEAMKSGAKFPPIVAFEDDTLILVADGFHRYAAAVRAGVKKIEVEVRSGGRREALLYAAMANVAHGLRHSNADKRRAVQRLLDDHEWAMWSDREIARRCGVSDHLVASLRDSGRENLASRKYVTRHGTVGERKLTSSKPQDQKELPQAEQNAGQNAPDAPPPQAAKKPGEPTQPLDEGSDASDQQLAGADAEVDEWPWPPDPTMEDYLKEATRAMEAVLEFGDLLAVADDDAYDHLIAKHRELDALHERVMAQRAATAVGA